MLRYRAYPVDREGHFIGATDFEAHDDAEAMQIVMNLADADCYELWSGSRHVSRVNADNVVAFTRPEDRSPSN